MDFDLKKLNKYSLFFRIVKLKIDLQPDLQPDLQIYSHLIL